MPNSPCLDLLVLVLHPVVYPKASCPAKLPFGLVFGSIPWEKLDEENPLFHSYHMSGLKILLLDSQLEMSTCQTSTALKC
jgi:hypothetical protein